MLSCWGCSSEVLASPVWMRSHIAPNSGAFELPAHMSKSWLPDPKQKHQQHEHHPADTIITRAFYVGLTPLRKHADMPLRNHLQTCIDRCTHVTLA